MYTAPDRESRAYMTRLVLSLGEDVTSLPSEARAQTEQSVLAVPGQTSVLACPPMGSESGFMLLTAGER